MDPSQQGNRGRQNKAPTAAQLQAFANAQTARAGVKRGANEVSDLEIPEASRPMLSLDRTRHRPNHPEIGSQQRPSSGPGNSSSPFTINASEPHVPPQQDDPSSAPRLTSQTAVDSSAPSDVMDSDVPEPSAATVSPASSQSSPLNSEKTPLSTILSLSVLDRRSPAVQSMLREAFNEGRAEGRRESEVKLDEAETKVEELRKKLDPSKLKAAYDRGWREGGIAGYNKYSLNPETKPSDDRLTFENICKEKDQAIHNQQMIMARYQKELMVRRQRIEMLERQVNFAIQQPPTQQQGQNISSQQISEAEARFGAQGQELAATRAQYELVRQDLTNWQVQWGMITADLEKWKAAFSTKAEQSDACQHQLDQSKRELKESKAKAHQLAVTDSIKTASLKAASEELESKLNVLSFDFNSLDRLYTTLAQVAAERSAEIDSIRAANEELTSNSERVQDGKEEINALTSINTDLVKLREQLEETVARQAEEIQVFSLKNEELAQKAKKREEEDARASQNRDEPPSQAMDQPTEETDDLPANLAQETAAADVELVCAMLERERGRSEAENRRREDRVTETLEAIRESERGRRQLLMDELEAKDAQIFDAQKQIRELSEKLLAASPSQSSPPPATPSSSSPPPETSLSPTPPPLPTVLTPPDAQSRSLFRLRRLPATGAEINFSPRRLLIILAIFLLAFLIPFLHSPSRPPSENITSGQVAIEALPEVEVRSREEAFEEGRRRWQAWAMTNWERTERIERGEGAGGQEEEYRPLPNWNH